jgi:hypothetical protein
VLARQGNLIAVARSWLITVGACLATPWLAWPMQVIGIFWMAVFAVQSVHKKSLWVGMQSVLKLLILAGGFVRG